MTYVASDLHGNFEKYLKLLEKIDLQPTDTLYILGDVCDRGPDSAEIYLDIMERENVILIMGNHEEMALEVLPHLLEEFPHELDPVQLCDRRELWDWLQNGGLDTISSFYSQPPETRKKILTFLQQLPYHAQREVEGQRYFFVHGGLGDYQDGGPLAFEDIPLWQLVWSKPKYNGSYLTQWGFTLVVGHTPTFLLKEPFPFAKIFFGKGNVINVDCGCAYPQYNGVLGCLRLEDQKEFYVVS